MLVEDRWGMPRAADPDRPEACTAFGAGDQWQLGDNPVVGLLLNAQEHERQIIGVPYINDDSIDTLRPDNPRTIAVYDSVDSSFILEDLFAKLRDQYLT